MDRKKSVVNKKSKYRVSIILGAVAAVLLVAAIAIVSYEQLKRDVVVEVDGAKLYSEDMMYFVLSTESMMAQTDQMYQSLTGSSYWAQTDENGVSNQVTGRESIKNQMVSTLILCDQAKKAGYQLTEEEKKTALDNVDSVYNMLLSPAQIKQAEFTKKQLTAVNEKIILSSRYRKDWIDTFDIDDAALKAGISYDENRQYDVQYYFVPTTEAQEDGTSKPMSAADKKAVYDEINDLYTNAKTAADFTKLITDQDKSKVTYQAKSFVAGDKQFEEDLEKQLKAMNNNDITSILDRNDGYYFFKMINNNSSETYDKAVEAAITAKEEEVFTEKYDEIYPQYKVTVVQKLLDSVVLGNFIKMGQK